MLKAIFKDSVVYGAANAVQKLVPLILIPLVINYLGPDALKIYDIAFVYAYLFSWLIILGQDSAASVFYFDTTKTSFPKKQIIAYGLIIQLVLFAAAGLIFLLFKNWLAHLLFATDSFIGYYWLIALLVLPGHILLNYSLNILLWQKRKKEYLAICSCQTIISVGSVYIAVVLLGGRIDTLFFCIISSTTASGLLAFWMTRHEMKFTAFPINKPLLRKMIWFGVPLALTSFLHQVLPSVDRFFLLNFHYVTDLPQYILAVKLGGFVSMGVAAFALAFTPYSLSKLNEAEAEKEISYLFRTVAVAGFMLVPLLLLFKGVLLRVFANTGFELSGKLLPFFFFGWVFDLFSYFSMLGVYKAQNSLLILLLFSTGVALSCLLNILLIPQIGFYGAAIAFCVSKASLFFLPVIFLKKYFRLSIHFYSFLPAAGAAIICSYIVYRVEWYLYLLITTALISVTALYLFKQKKLAFVGN